MHTPSRPLCLSVNVYLHPGMKTLNDAKEKASEKKRYVFDWCQRPRSPSGFPC